MAAAHHADIIYERLELRPGGEEAAKVQSETRSSVCAYSKHRHSPDNLRCMTGIEALKTVALHVIRIGFRLAPFCDRTEGKHK